MVVGGVFVHRSRLGHSRRWFEIPKLTGKDAIFAHVAASSSLRAAAAGRKTP